MYIGTIFKIMPSLNFSAKMKILCEFVVKILINLVTISRFTNVSKIIDSLTWVAVSLFLSDNVQTHL